MTSNGITQDGIAFKTPPTADWLYRGILGLIASVAMWILATPVIRPIATATMHRFHLSSHSFATWAMQFPIPAMYNFSNRSRVGREITDLLAVWDEHESYAMEPWQQMNHFPARGFTFANVRWRYLRQHEPRRFELETNYRGQNLRSTYDLIPIVDTDFELIRVASAYSDGELSGDEVSVVDRIDDE